MADTRNLRRDSTSRVEDVYRRLTELVQGTMALEAEAVEASVLEQMEEANFRALLSGPPRRLWAA